MRACLRLCHHEGEVVEMSTYDNDGKFHRSAQGTKGVAFLLGPVCTLPFFLKRACSLLSVMEKVCFVLPFDGESLFRLALLAAEMYSRRHVYLPHSSGLQNFFSKVQ